MNNWRAVRAARHLSDDHAGASILPIIVLSKLPLALRSNET
jgi:hypothetical protein